MREKHVESPVDGVVLRAFKAYRAVLARHDLLAISKEETQAALSSLQLETGRIESRDIRFQAAVARLEGRKGLSHQSMEDVLHELLVAEYECDQAQWERDCDRRAHMAHANWRLKPHAPAVAAVFGKGRSPRSR